MARIETEFGPGGYGASEAEVPGTPTFVAHTSSTIDITFDTGDNADAVEYAIYEPTLGKWVGADGAADEASAVWQTFTAWGGSAITLTGLATLTAYTWQVKARNEDGAETALCTASAVMNCLPSLDQGLSGATLVREVTPADARIVSGSVEVDTANANTDTEGSTTYCYGDVPILYTAQTNDARDVALEAQFSEDYDPEAGTGTWAACTQGTGGDGTTGLETSVAGTEHTYMWNSYTDCGASEKDTTVYVRLRVLDASPTGGDASDWVVSDAIAINNRPAAITWTNSDECSWGEDTTPVFVAAMPSLRSGTVGWPEIRVYDSAALSNLLASYASYESIAEWEYSTDDGDTWTAMAVTGIPYTATHIRCTVPAADALAAGTYYLAGEMWEPQARG